MSTITIDLSFIPGSIRSGRWRIWLLAAAIILAAIAQSLLPPAGYTLSPDQPLPAPLWKTLMLFEGPLEPYRAGVLVYLFAMALVIVAFADKNVAPLPRQLLNFKPPTADESLEADPRARPAVSFSLNNWQLTLRIGGTKRQWVTIWWPTIALTASGTIAIVVFGLFKAPDGQSNPGLALWMSSVYLLLAVAATYDWIQPGGPKPSRVVAGLLLTSMAFSGASIYFLWLGQGNIGTLFWSIGAVCLILIYFLGRPREAGNSTTSASLPLWIELSVFAGIMLIAAYFRLVHITGLTPGVNNDSAEAGRVAISYALGLTPYTPFSSIGWGFESLFIYYIALWVQLVTPAYVAIRLAAATVGIATIAAVYLFGRRVGGPPLGWLAATLAAASGIHIIFSGTGLRLILQPLFEVATLIFIWQGFEHGRLKDFLLGGVFLGLALNAHISSRPDPALIALFVVFLFISAVGHRRFFIRRFTGPLIVGALATFVTAAPLIGYASGNWVTYASRADFVYVKHRMDEMEARYPGSYWSPFVRNLVVGSLVLNQRGNGNDFFIDDPALDFPVNFLLPLAVAFALRYWRKPLLFLLLSWFGMGMVTGYFSEPNANRMVAAIMPGYFMIAVFLFACVKMANTLYGRGMKLVAVSAVGLTAISIVLFTYRDYVGPSHRYRWGYAEDATANGAFVASLLADNQNDVYVTDAYFVTDVVRLLTYEWGEHPFAQPYPYSRFDMAQALSGGFPRAKPVTVVLGSWKEEEWAREALLERYPGSRVEPIPRIDTPWNSESDPPAGYAITIPLEALDDDSPLRTGYFTRFYNSPDWQGTPYVSYIDRFFAFPIEALFVPFSASWNGILPIDQPGEYGFRLVATNRAQLLIDRTAVINLDSFDIESANERQQGETRIQLDSGNHLLRILYSYEAGDRQIQLLWSTPDRPEYDWIPMDLIVPNTNPSSDGT